MADRKLNYTADEINSILSKADDFSVSYRKDWYKPITQNDTILGSETIPLEYSMNNYEGFLDWIMNKLLLENPDYITKTTLGFDTSNTYKIYKYDFKPVDYEKTIILFSCLHGNEYTSFFGLCRFLETLCNNPNKDANLEYLRNNIRFVVVPIANPWGFINEERQNVNGVDLNRNFNYRWEELVSKTSQIGETYYKGTSPLSEEESKLFDGLVQSLCNEDCNLVASIDFHTIITVDAEKILYYPRFHDNIISELRNVMETYSFGENRCIFSSSSLPTLSNHMSFHYGLNCCNPEWNNKCYGVDRNSVNMTQWVEYMGNIILAMAKYSGKRMTPVKGAFSKNLLYYADPTLLEEDSNRMSYKGFRIPNTEEDNYYTMETSKYEFKIDSQYIIKVSGMVQVVVEKETEICILPMLYQKYAPEQKYSTIEEETRYEVKFKGVPGQTYFIPINACIQGYHSNYNVYEETETQKKTARADVVHFRFKAVSDITSAAYICAYNVNILGIPSDVGVAVSIENVTESGLTTIFPLRLPEDIED